MKNYSVAAAFIAALTLMGCSSTTDDILSPENDGSTKLAITTRSESAQEANYAHKALLVSGTSIADIKKAATLSGLEAFSVEPGEYTTYATAASDETNLTFSGISVSDEITSARIKITDMGTQIPDLLIGKSAPVTVGVEGGTANILLTRVVAALDIAVSGLETVEAASITLTIKNMYDQVDWDGTPLKSGSEFASKTINLAKNAEGKFVGNAIVMPTDTEAGQLSLVYNVNGTVYASSPNGKIEANGKYELKTTVESGSTPTMVQLQSVVTYAAWNTTVINLSDSFTLTEEPTEKQWTGPTPLAIGGAPSPDNFWASSDAGGTEWGESYFQTNLFDGNKTDGANYWCPANWDYSTPTWYIDLGEPKEGVTIDYWNKAGGKGGQKIKTMDIYASTDKADYQGGNTNWVLIKTFTSDKTTATVDAGAQVSTGQIKFAEDGNTSFQYVKCVVTSKVDPNNVTNTEQLDVNVGEVEISTWSYK